MELREIASRAPELARRSSRWLSARRERKEASAQCEFRSAITIGRPPDEVYKLWLDPGNLAQVMAPFAEIEPLDGDRLRWRARTPKKPLEWETSIKDKEPGHRIAWLSPSVSLPHEAAVDLRSAPGGRGTEVHLTFRFQPPGGKLGRAAAELLGHAPDVLAEKTLRRFKSLVETGEIPTLAHTPAGKQRILEK